MLSTQTQEKWILTLTLPSSSGTWADSFSLLQSRFSNLLDHVTPNVPRRTTVPSSCFKDKWFPCNLSLTLKNLHGSSTCWRRRRNRKWGWVCPSHGRHSSEDPQVLRPQSQPKKSGRESHLYWTHTGCSPSHDPLSNKVWHLSMKRFTVLGLERGCKAQGVCYHCAILYKGATRRLMALGPHLQPHRSWLQVYDPGLVLATRLKVRTLVCTRSPPLSKDWESDIQVNSRSSGYGEGSESCKLVDFIDDLSCVLVESHWWRSECKH